MNKSKVYCDEIEWIVENIPNPSFYRNKTVMITGATGYIGSTMLQSIIRLNEKQKLNIDIVALVRNEEKLLKSIGEKNFENITVICQDILDPIKFRGNVDILVHTANITNSKDMLINPLGVFDNIVKSTDNIIDFSKDKSVEVLINLSSMEVYGFQEDEVKLNETTVPRIDHRNPRMSYQLGKQVSEFKLLNSNLFSTRKISIRLGQIFGPGVDVESNKIFNLIAKSIINDRNIELATSGESINSYCYISDAIVGIFYVIRYGEDKEIYNLNNEDMTSSIVEMAIDAIKNSKSSIQVHTNVNSDNISRNQFPKETKLVLDSSKLVELGWSPKTNMENAYTSLMMYLRENVHE